MESKSVPKPKASDDRIRGPVSEPMTVPIRWPILSQQPSDSNIGSDRKSERIPDLGFDLRSPPLKESSPWSYPRGHPGGPFLSVVISKQLVRQLSQRNQPTQNALEQPITNVTDLTQISPRTPKRMTISDFDSVVSLVKSAGFFSHLPERLTSATYGVQPLPIMAKSAPRP